MAFGKETGQFSVKLTSQTYGPSSGNGISIQANMEGTASGTRGEGEVALTHYAEGELGAKSGTWSQHGMARLKDGSFIGFHIQGTWNEISAGKWHYRGSGQLSDGSTYSSEFEGDWATKTWAGKLYE